MLCWLVGVGGEGERLPLKDFDNVRAVMLPIWEGGGEYFCELLWCREFATCFCKLV